MKKAEFIRKNLRQIIKQGNNSEISKVFQEIWDACESEFTEDNIATRVSFILDGFFEAITNSTKHVYTEEEIINLLNSFLSEKVSVDITSLTCGDTFLKDGDYYTPVGSCNTRILCVNLKTGAECWFSSYDKVIRADLNVERCLMSEDLNYNEHTLLSVVRNRYCTIIDFEKRCGKGYSEAVRQLFDVVQRIDVKIGRS